MFGIRKENIQLQNGHMEYITFGTGKPLVIIPGLGDGLQTVHSISLYLKLFLKQLAKNHSIYVISFKEPVDKETTTEILAEEYYRALNKLRLEKIDLVGFSFGGMVAQHLAANYPSLVDMLILCSTTNKANANFRQIAEKWKTMAKNEQADELLQNIVQKISGKTLFCSVPVQALAKISKLNLERFAYLAAAVKEHDCTAKLIDIQSKTLVLGGSMDKLTSTAEFLCLNRGIQRSKLIIVPGGHTFFIDRKKEFMEYIQNFLVM